MWTAIIKKIHKLPLLTTSDESDNAFIECSIVRIWFSRIWTFLYIANFENTLVCRLIILERWRGKIEKKWVFLKNSDILKLKMTQKYNQNLWILGYGMRYRPFWGWIRTRTTFYPLSTRYNGILAREDEFTPAPLKFGQFWDPPENHPPRGFWPRESVLDYSRNRILLRKTQSFCSEFNENTVFTLPSRVFTLKPKRARWTEHRTRWWFPSD